jgi:hypothetical protein
MPRCRELLVLANCGLTQRNKPTAILDLAVPWRPAKPFLQVALHWVPTLSASAQLHISSDGGTESGIIAAISPSRTRAISRGFGKSLKMRYFVRR